MQGEAVLVEDIQRPRERGVGMADDGQRLRGRGLNAGENDGDTGR